MQSDTVQAQRDTADPSRSKPARLLAALGVGVLVLLGLFLLADVETLASYLRSTDAPLLALALLGFVVGTALRAYRFELLAGSEISGSLRPFFRVTAAHQLLLMLLPFRAGELSYPVLLRRQLQRPIARGTGDLVVARLLDLVLCGACLALGLLALPAEGRGASLLTGLSGVVMALGTLGLALLPKLVRGARLALVRWRQGSSFSRFHGVDQFLFELDSAIGAMGWRRLGGTLAVSALASSVAIVRIYLMFAAFQANLDLLGATFLFAAANLVGLIPLHGFGGLGPKQVGIAGALVLLGWGSSAAASLTLLFQASMILFVALVALLGYALRMPERQDQEGGGS